MSADLIIHLYTDGSITDEQFGVFFRDHLGSRWARFCPKGVKWGDERHRDAWDAVLKTDYISVGGNSALKAMIFGDLATYVPGPVDVTFELIGEDHPFVTDELIAKFREKASADNLTSYSCSALSKIANDLENHKGKRAFLVNW